MALRIATTAGAGIPALRGDGVVVDLGDGRCRLVKGSWSWAGLAAGLGQLDADIEIVGPPELRAAFDRLARRYAVAAGR